MDALTRKQAHVLTNFDRVALLPRKLKTIDQRRRYQLDGTDCTAQITALVIKQYLAHTPTGVPRKLRSRRVFVAREDAKASPSTSSFPSP